MEMREYSINGVKYRLNLFEKIENKHQAYLIGYLCGDGGINTSTHKRKARVYVVSVAKDTIDYFKDTYCPDNEVSVRLNNNVKKGIFAKQPAYTLNFSSKFSETFNKFGILSKKEDRVLVNIPKRFMRYYILGIFDADGHISFGNRKDRNRLWGNFAITHQSYNVLHSIQTYLVNELNIATSVTQRKEENCIDLKTSNRDSLLKIFHWIYSDADEIKYNKKKYYNFKKFTEEYMSDAT
jgi:hypothetical protein